MQLQEKKSKGNREKVLEATLSALAKTMNNYESIMKALKAAKLAITTAGAKSFKLYGVLLSDEARQQGEKIIKVQVTHAP